MHSHKCASVPFKPIPGLLGCFFRLVPYFNSSKTALFTEHWNPLISFHALSQTCFSRLSRCSSWFFFSLSSHLSHNLCKNSSRSSLSSPYKNLSTTSTSWVSTCRQDPFRIPKPVDNFSTPTTTCRSWEPVQKRKPLSSFSKGEKPGSIHQQKKIHPSC